MELIPVDLEALVYLLEGLQSADNRGDALDSVDSFLNRTGLWPDAWCETHERYHIRPVEDGDYDEPCED